MSYFQDIRVQKTDPTDTSEQAKFLKKNADGGAEVHVDNFPATQAVNLSGAYDAGNSTTSALPAFLGSKFIDEASLASYFGSPCPTAPADTYLGAAFTCTDFAGFGIEALASGLGQGYAIWENAAGNVTHIDTTPFAGAGSFFDPPQGATFGRIGFQNRSAAGVTFICQTTWKRTAPGLFMQPVSAPVDPSFPAAVVKSLHMYPLTLTTTPLAAGASYSSTAFPFANPTTGYIFATNWADVDMFVWGAPFNAHGTAYFAFSMDGVTDHIGPVPVQVNDLTAVLPLPLRNFPYVRLAYTNSTIAQTSFLFALVQRATVASDLTRLLTQVIGPGEPVKVTRALIEPSIVGARGVLGADRTISGETLFTERLRQQDIQFYHDDPNQVLTVTASGGATAVQNVSSGDASFKSSTAATASIRAATGVVKYRSAKESFFFWTARFVAAPTHANTKAFIGPLNSTEGFAVGLSGSATPQLLYRYNSVDTLIPQSSWNGDPLNNTFLSRFNRGNELEAVNFLLYNVWRLRFEWFGAATVHWEILNPDGTWMTVHTLRNPNSLTAPFLMNPDIPIACEVSKSGGDAQNMELRSGCWAGGSAGTIGEFDRILNRHLVEGEEMRLDVEPTNTDLYIGVSKDGFSTANPTWGIVRIYLSATKNPTRMRFRDRVAWDNRTVGW